MDLTKRMMRRQLKEKKEGEVLRRLWSLNCISRGEESEMNPFELMLNGINGIWMFIIMMITFWSRCELEDLGRVGPAFLVPRLDYHLRGRFSVWLSWLNHQDFMMFSLNKVWSADKESENCAPHNRNQGPTRRRWNALCRWGLMWMNISREGHYWRWINKTWSWMLHHKIKEFLISQTMLFGINFI